MMNLKRMIALSGMAACVLAAQTVPVTVTVNWPNSDIVGAKYGKLPKSMFPGEVTGCSGGTQNIVFSQGLVIQGLRANNLQAYSRTDAIAVITAAQRNSARSKWLVWSPVASSALDAVNGFIVTRVLTVSTGWGMAITTATALTDKLLPIVNGPLQANPYITYDTDGMQALMQLAPGDCAVGTVMFATPGTAPAPGLAGPPITLQVPAVTRLPAVIATPKKPI